MAMLAEADKSPNSSGMSQEGEANMSRNTRGKCDAADSGLQQWKPKAGKSRTDCRQWMGTGMVPRHMRPLLALLKLVVSTWKVIGRSHIVMY